MESYSTDQLANDLKSRGNTHFKEKDYESAIKNYSDAIQLRNDDSILYSNRAQCYLNLERYYEAIEDCDNALRLNPLFTKAFYRRASANKQLFRYETALKDFHSLIELDPSFDKAFDEIRAVEKMMESSDRQRVSCLKKPEHMRSSSAMKIFPVL